jgi:hypothetical protein
LARSVMAIMLDPVTIVNLILSLTILVLGITAYGKKKNSLALYIGAAFGLFALSHLLTLLGLAQSLTVFLIAIRTLAYVIVIFALLTLWKRPTQ